MTPQELIDQVRLKTDDTITPYNFSDSDILTALNDAQNEFARKTLCLFASAATINGGSSSGNITLTAGTLWVTAANITNPLHLVTEHALDFGYFELNEVESANRFTNWRRETGTPLFGIPNYGTQTLRLVPIPATDVDVVMDYYRLPLAPIALSPEVAAEISSVYHPDLVIGAVAYLCEIPDQEVYDKETAVLKRVDWQKRIAMAAVILQTSLRMQTRLLQPPPGVGFISSEAQ